MKLEDFDGENLRKTKNNINNMPQKKTIGFDTLMFSFAS